MPLSAMSATYTGFVTLALTESKAADFNGPIAKARRRKLSEPD